MIHGPSLIIGAAVSAGFLLVSFLVFDDLVQENELVMQPTPQIEQDTKIPLDALFDNGSPILGNPDAPITLVEFGDYQCHFCNVFFHNTEESILKNYVETDKVKIIFKDYTIIGQDSVTAAHGAHCADDQDMFWEYHDVLYNNWTGENNGWASSENLLRFAQDIGLDITQWSNCMLESKYSDIISASNNDAKTLDLTGTPSFFIINEENEIAKIYGAKPYQEFERIFNSMLEN